MAVCLRLWAAQSGVGASLLAMAVGLLALMLDGPASSRAGSLPQGLVVCLGLWAAQSDVGASLLAMAVGLLALVSDGLMSSRASPAPTGFGGVPGGCGLLFMAQKKRHLSVPFIYCRALTCGLLPTISAVRRSSRFRL
ncbi:hypothetical protein FGE05_10130 [Pseudomonas sp. ICMP22404]|nr:hypothetical protein FGE05_10130 [Pseudomonas sp. ICMP22404]